jgi:hypothetical protein
MGKNYLLHGTVAANIHYPIGNKSGTGKNSHDLFHFLGMARF